MTGRDVGGELDTSLGQMGAQGRDAGLGQGDHPVLVALGSPHGQAQACGVDILDAQAQGFEQTQPAAVEEFRDQPVGAHEAAEDRGNFRRGEYHRNARTPLAAYRPDGIIRQRSLQEVPVDEDQSVEGLVLGGLRHLPIGRQMGEEGSHLVRTQFVGVAVAMEDHIASEPIEIGLLGAFGQLVKPRAATKRIPQLRQGDALRKVVCCLHARISRVWCDIQSIILELRWLIRMSPTQ